MKQKYIFLALIIFTIILQIGLILGLFFGTITLSGSSDVVIITGIALIVWLVGEGLLFRDVRRWYMPPLCATWVVLVIWSIFGVEHPVPPRLWCLL